MKSDESRNLNFPVALMTDHMGPQWRLLFNTGLHIATLYQSWKRINHTQVAHCCDS